MCLYQGSFKKHNLLILKLKFGNELNILCEPIIGNKMSEIPFVYAIMFDCVNGLELCGHV